MHMFCKTIEDTYLYPEPLLDLYVCYSCTQVSLFSKYGKSISLGVSSPFLVVFDSMVVFEVFDPLFKKILTCSRIGPGTIY